VLKVDIAKRFGRRPLVLLGVVIAAIALNPLGLTSASSRASEDIIARFLAPFYDSDPRPITVVLFDDASLRELDLSWPAPYRVTVALLRKVLCAEPRAVFLDLLFTHEHKGEPPGAFENLVLNLSGDRGSCRGAPIYVADMADQVHYPVPGNSVVHERLREKPKIQRVPANWVADEGLYPLAMSTIDPSTWPTALGGRYLPSPAFALYRLEEPDADINNIGGRFAGALTAALFLERFVGEGVPWVHIDMASSFSQKSKPWLDAGATGALVRTLVKVARGL